MLYERPEAPVEIASSRSPTGNTGVLLIAAFTAQTNCYEVDLTAWRKARNLSHLRRDMDGVTISDAIAATCGPAISFLVGQVNIPSENTLWPPTHNLTYQRIHTFEIFGSKLQNIDIN